MPLIEMTNDKLNETLNNNDIVVLDFWASWCGPCRAFAPVFERVSKLYPDIVFGRVNTEREQELSALFNVMSIPTLVVFRQNFLLFEQAGAIPEMALKKLIEEIKALDMEKVKEEMDEETSLKR